MIRHLMIIVFDGLQMAEWILRAETHHNEFYGQKHEDDGNIIETRGRLGSFCGGCEYVQL